MLAEAALERASKTGPDTAAARAGAAAGSRAPSLRNALLSPGVVAVIAEVKRSSPSRGAINPSIDSGSQALAYRNGGAAAISVLTEPQWFGGADADIGPAAASSGLPILKKDFHVSTSQLVHARSLGASAALVIVRAVEPALLAEMAQAANEIGLELVFEVRDETELDAALGAGADIVGVNNRNLETLVTDPTTVERIVPLIPRSCVAIAESGYSSRESVEVAARAGADAVLAGSFVSAASDPAAAVRLLAGVPATGARRSQAGD